MANTVIQLKRSTTPGAAPSSLAVGELAVNLPDRKLFVGNGSAVYELGLSSGGSNTQIQFNDSGQANGSATFTYNKTTDTVTLANTLIVGNATINAVVNSTSIKLANSTTSITIANPNTTQANGSHYLNGNGSWTVPAGGGGGTPGGANTQVQFNNSGAFGGDAAFTFNSTTDVLTLGNSTVYAAITGLTAPTLKIANATSNITISVPNTTAAAATNYFLSANGTWAQQPYAIRQSFTANSTVNTQFVVSGGYLPGQIDVYMNGIKLVNGVDVTVSSGANVVLSTAAVNGDIIEVVGQASLAPTTGIVRQTFTANATVNTQFAVTGGYVPSQIDVYLNGSKLVNGTDVTTTSGANVVLATAASVGDIIDVVGYVSASVYGSGTPTGSNGSLQFNSSGAFAGHANLIFDTTNNVLIIGGTSATSSTERLRLNGNANNYHELSIKNSNTGVGGSTDLTINTNDANDTFGFLNLGINSNTYSVAGFGSGPRDSYLYSSNSHLWIGTASANAIIFHANGTAATNEMARISSAGFNVGNTTVNTFISSNSTTTTIKLSNSTVNWTISVPNTTAASATNYFLNANGVWSQVTAGGSVGGSNTYVLFNDSGVANGHANLVYDKATNILGVGGTISLTSQASVPTAPNSGIGVLYVANVAGRYMPSAIGNSGINYQFHPHLGRNRFQMLNVLDNTAAPVGIGTGTANTGAMTARALATGNTFVSTRRTGIVTAATANVSTEIRGSRATYYLGAAAGEGGFHFFARAGTAAFQTGASVFIGLHTGTATIGNIALTAIRTGVGFGINPGTNNWVVFSANATAANTIDLGTSFPCNTATTDMYEFMMFAKPNSSTVTYRVVNIRSGSDTSGTMNTACMPAVSTLMTWKAYLNNGATATAAGVDLASIYIESDNSG